MKIYLAGPITGFTVEEVITNITSHASRLSIMGYDVLHPFIGSCGVSIINGPLQPYGYTGISSDHSIFCRDKWCVLQADIIIVNLIGAKRVSIGSMMELAWASDHNKHTIVVIEDNNMHQHAFVKEAADLIFTELDSAFDYLEKLIRRTL